MQDALLFDQVVVVAVLLAKLDSRWIGSLVSTFFTLSLPTLQAIVFPKIALVVVLVTIVETCCGEETVIFVVVVGATVYILPSVLSSWRGH